jgi:cytochrome c-type biogenesis protein CcmH/NrfG
VVLVPLSAALLVLIAVSSKARRSLDLITAVLAVLALVCVPITTDAGEWLQHHLPRTPLMRVHTQLGDTMLPWAIALALVAVLVLVEHRWWRPRRHAHRRHSLGASGASGGRRRMERVAGTALAVLAVVVAVGSVVTVYRIGDSGARAAWTGQVSAQPLPSATHQPHSGG